MMTNIFQQQKEDVPHIFMIICASDDEQTMLEQIELGIVALRSAVGVARIAVRFSLLVDGEEVGQMYQKQLEMWPQDILR